MGGDEERPFADLDTEDLELRYRAVGVEVNAAGRGFGRKKLEDRHSEMARELRLRGVDPGDVWDPTD